MRWGWEGGTARDPQAVTAGASRRGRETATGSRGGHDPSGLTRAGGRGKGVETTRNAKMTGGGRGEQQKTQRGEQGRGRDRN